MPNRYYRNVKFRYTRDDGNQIIKAQRVYRDNTGFELTPITPIFNDFEVLTTAKILPTQNDFLRHSEAQLTEDRGIFKIAIPARGDDPRHKQQQQEIAALDRVACIRYQGEFKDYLN
ncbi:hypothetical protein [Spirulina sp. 06S082]|uniref:hypothetical protein n=1 Tax=Spirulina sp. 06S082 TaxID=3110248 RepID=UPI002B214492|nr:hypothetical protein [Spirulina sp. 06S082]MEA5467988.1 hypothetical protein [Spirulina sp. 06S082]